ncbi:hypothetical protein HanIR_Chr10g0480311 [Helianthus annuus]|nr:hypothetical protein HanIR_Chr10g0480311 [Helianthus annuus]
MKVIRIMSRQASSIEAAANEMLYGCCGIRLGRFICLKIRGVCSIYLCIFIYVSSVSIVSLSIEDNVGIKCGEGRRASSVCLVSVVS